MSDWGVIFDWDGVIVDSREAHRKSWDMLAERENRPLPDGHFERSFGMRNQQIIPEVLQWSDRPEEIQRLSASKEQAYRDLITRSGIETLPGVRSLLRALQDEAVPAVIGSSTPRANLDCALELLGLGSAFRDLVAAEDVERGKPHPEPFLKAAQKIGMPPDRCVVIEDAHVGIAAAKAGGMAVLAVATTHAAGSLTGADRVEESLEDISPAVLKQLLV